MPNILDKVSEGVKYVALTSATSHNFEFMFLLAGFAGVARRVPPLVTSGLKDCFN